MLNVPAIFSVYFHILMISFFFCFHSSLRLVPAAWAKVRFYCHFLESSPYFSWSWRKTVAFRRKLSLFEFLSPSSALHRRGREWWLLVDGKSKRLASSKPSFLLESVNVQWQIHSKLRNSIRCWLSDFTPTQPHHSHMDDALTKQPSAVFHFGNQAENKMVKRRRSGKNA